MLKKPKKYKGDKKPMSPLMRLLIRKLYQLGNSYRDIEKLVDFSASTISKICCDIIRTRSEAAKLKSPRKSIHWRTSRHNARKTMEESLGRSLNYNEHVHHIDKDYTNNNLSNLEILSPSEHAKLHHPKNPTPRHLRADRKAYMKAYLREYIKTYKRR